jgi:predicted unusual protein kinase regulating ubiquinone biosynthesis (AarF/ABC1/UbiB family)
MAMISLRPKHLARYRDLARLLVKHGRSDIVASAGLDGALLDEDRTEPAVDESAAAEQLAKDLEELGPTYIKLGQLLSTRADLFSDAYVEALSRLQDSVEPFPFHEVEQIVSEELGVRISKAFASFDPKPIAAASLGQVHRAALRDGRAVAVKVQRPHIRERVRDDLEALAELADFIDKHTEPGRRYRFGRNVGRVSEISATRAGLSIGGREPHDLRSEPPRVRSPPRARADHGLLELASADDGLRARPKDHSAEPLTRLELDGEALGDELFRAYLKQVLVDGVFHADPHPGNIFLTDDHGLALIDLGRIGHVTPQMQERLVKLLLAVAEGEGEQAANIAFDTGEKLDGFDERQFIRRVAQVVTSHHDVSLHDVDVGRVFTEITRISGANGVRQPPELTLLGKTLLNLDQVARTLAPDFNPTKAIRRHAMEIMRRRMLRAASPGNVFAAALELNEFVQRLPGRLNRALDRVAGNDLELRVNAIDEEQLISGLQKIANRITLGLVLAALIVGGALLMRVPTGWSILGYPAFAMILFLIAAIAGLLLAYSIVAHDRRVSKPPH